ncbi:MAG TPA: flagellar basal-body rod protein FlgF [Armatimonadota bacterium]|nr:flagellar basal-body rod protein FlgF [Armatimonadota bacterium]
MVRGIYSAASGMLAQQMRLDAVANNIANVNTNGFRREITAVSSFDKALDTAMSTDSDGVWSAPNMPNPFVLSPYAASDATVGPIIHTGNPTDLALHGQSFFTVRTGNGVAYTRNGSFSLDTNGRLVTADGNPVLGEHGEIVIDNPKWQVTTNGTVVVNGNSVDKLQLADIPNLSAATRIGNNLWSTANAVPANNVMVEQGCVEGSNVNAVSEMVELINTSRQFEANQRCLQLTDTTLDRAVNDIGRV